MSSKINCNDLQNRCLGQAWCPLLGDLIGFKSSGCVVANGECDLAHVTSESAVSH